MINILTQRRFLPRPSNSKSWKHRQLTDYYVKQAHEQNYRSRSAFKLLQAQQKYQFIRPGMLVLDCGSSPGGFSQVAAQCCDASVNIASQLSRHLQPSSHITVQTTHKNGGADIDSNDSVAPSLSSQIQQKSGDTFESINASDLNNRNQGAVVAIDLLPMESIPGVCALYPWDFTHSHTVSRLRQALGKRRFDVILSDMSPNLTGQLDVDHDRSVELCRYAIRAAQTLPLRTGGALFFKSIQGAQTVSLRKELEQMFNFVKIIKPEASRKESREVYILCQNYNGTKHIK